MGDTRLATPVGSNLLALPVAPTAAAGPAPRPSISLDILIRDLQAALPNRFRPHLQLLLSSYKQLLKLQESYDAWADSNPAIENDPLFDAHATQVDRLVETYAPKVVTRH